MTTREMTTKTEPPSNGTSLPSLPLAPTSPTSPPLHVPHASPENIGIATRRTTTSRPRQEQFPIRPPFMLNSVPTCRPTTEQFSDPMAFVDSVKELGRQYGAVKVVPPATWSTECQFKDLTLLRFRTVVQALAQSTSNYDEKLRFYKDLVRFHQAKKVPLLRLPLIDKRVVDLFKLRQSVNAKGGFNTVCAKKLWAQIGRELGYTGRTMTSLSTSLKVAYLKVVYSYDLHLQEKEGKDIKLEPSQDVNGENKRPLDVPISKNNGSHDPTDQQRKRPKLKEPLPTAPHKSRTEVSHITNSRTVFRRPRDLLKAKGFRTNFESITQEKQGITERDFTTYQHYDFNYWHKGVQVIDHPFPGPELSPTQDFASFFEANLKNSHLLDTTEEDLIDRFWSQMEGGKGFKVETAHNLPTVVHGSGFPTLPHVTATNKEQVLDPWNLNNLPIHEEGVLRYLSDDHEPLTRPSLNISSNHSVQSFNVTDHFLFQCDYHHMGAPKVWYFLNPQDRAKYEEVLSRCLQDCCSKLGDEEGSHEDLFADPIAMDILEGLQQDDQFDVRASATNSHFDKLYDHKPALHRFNADLLISPALLVRNGLQVNYTIQYPGEFIIKFPQAYSSTVSLGVSLTESVPFAPMSWLDIGLEAEMWLWKQGLMPAFSYRQLLCNIVEESRDSKVLKIVQPHFDQFVSEEIQLRSDLKSLLGSSTKVVSNKFDYICDDSLANSFPTKVVLTSGSDTFMTDPRRIIGHPYKVNDLNPFKLEIHVFYTDDKLRVMQRNLITQSQTPEDWLAKFDALLNKGTLPSLKSLKALHSESERISAVIPEALTLGKFLHIANGWIERCQDLLNAKQKNRIRNRRQTKDENEDEDKQFEFEVLESLINEIPSLNFHAPEVDQVIELSNEIRSFEHTTRTFLLEKGHTEEEFMELIDLGKSFGIKLQSIDVLERVVARWQWLAEYDAFVKSDVVSLEYIIDLLIRGYEVCSSNDDYSLKILRQRIYDGKLWSQRAAKELQSENMSLESLTAMCDATQHVPLEFALADKLKEAKARKLRELGVISTITSQIQSNASELANLTRVFVSTSSPNRVLISKQSPDFDAEAYENFLEKYSGGEEDSRPDYYEVKEIFEKSQAMTTATGTSQAFIDVHLHMEAVESWQKKAKRIFGKVNAPIHLLKTHLDILNTKVKHAFSVTDSFDPVQAQDEDHELFCFCRRPESGTMIACERCLEWYHCKCLKFARGKSKEVEHYICPICDYRVEIPKEYDTPNIEEMQQLVEEGALLRLKPKELPMAYSIWKEAEKFRLHLKEVLTWEQGSIIGDDVALFKFYLRKLEGASVLLADEYNQLRQLIWKIEKLTPEAPPIVATGNKTKKKRIPKAKDDSITEADVSMQSNGGASTAPSTPAMNGTRLVKIPIIQPVKSGESQDSPIAHYATVSRPKAEVSADQLSVHEVLASAAVPKEEPITVHEALEEAVIGEK